MKSEGAFSRALTKFRPPHSNALILTLGTEQAQIGSRIKTYLPAQSTSGVGYYSRSSEGGPMMRAFTTKARAVGWPIVLLSLALAACAQETPVQAVRLDRLVALAKLWAAVKYFHPYLAYRDDIDWDEALVKAIAKVDAAKSGMDYSAAVSQMLGELGDPATGVLTAPPPKKASSTTTAERQPTVRTTADGWSWSP